MRQLGGILLLVGACLAGTNDPLVPCPPEEAPVLDGRLDDAAWRRVPAVAIRDREHIHPNYRAEWKGEQDLSAEVRALVAKGDLYLGFTVRDDVLLHEPGRSWWAGDAIEVFFDTDLCSAEDGLQYSNDDLQLFLMPFHEGLRWGVVARGPDVPYPDGGLRGIELEHRRTADGYTVEVRIPLWNLEPLRPDADGRIGFDVALNDVDDPAAEQAQTYMTLSGRFELHAKPANFARLAIGRRTPPPPPQVDEGPLVDWSGLLLGLFAVILLAYAARRVARSIARRTRVRAATLCALFGAGAIFCAFLPFLARLVDESAVRARWKATLLQVDAAATACLDLDTGDAESRAARLLALFRDGQVHIRPRYDYTFLPLTEEARRGPSSAGAEGPQHYAISLTPGEARTFPLEGLRAPGRLRVDLSMPEPEERGAHDRPAAAISLQFSEGAPILATAPHGAAPRVFLDTSERSGEKLRALVVSNRLASRALVVDGLYAKEEGGGWSALPLAFRTRTGVPFDIWRGTPRTHLRPVPAGERISVPAAGARGHRLWVALAADGAYPATPYGAEVATLRVHYTAGEPGPTLKLVNGRDVRSRLLAYARVAGDPESVALEWEDRVRQPMLYTLHSLELDPSRRVARVEIADGGVLTGLTWAAATIGRRALEAPPRGSGLRLSGDRLFVREEVRAAWAGLGFSVRAPSGTTASYGPADGVPARVELPFGGSEHGAIEVRMPRGAWASAIEERESFVFGVAALLFAFAAVVAGATILQRARRLRVKMLVALGAATVVPLLFLVVSLTRILSERAETDLEKATRTDLLRMGDRIAARKARARELAMGTRDQIALVPAGRPETLRRQSAHSREEIEAQGAFLRLPELDPGGPSPLGNVSFVDAITRSGLYYSPWDGLLGIGVARTSDRRRCMVGLPAPELLAGAREEGVTAALFGPSGEPLAMSGGVPEELRTTAARRRNRQRLAEAQRTGQPVYEAAATLRGEPVAAAHTILKGEGGQLVGLLGIYRARASTDAAKADILRTLLLSTLAALLLVVIAGGTLVDLVTQRLQRVTRAARAIAQGDLESRAPIEADDEVGRLASSFNTMADSLDERVRQLTELHRGLHELTSALDRTEVGRAAVTLLARATGAPNVQVSALEPTSQHLEPLHRTGAGAPLGPRLPERGPARDAVELKRAVVREGAAFLPLVAGDRVVGLAVCSPVAETDTAFLDVTGRQIGVAIENARLYQAAVTDELTGLYTRAFLVRRLKEEVDRAAATGRPLSLLRLVIDDYGGLTQRHGAAVAAKLVVETAAVVERALPRRNMLARGQPDELLALLVESDADAARGHVDRIATALRRHAFAALRDEPAPAFTYRTVAFPEDGAGADILLDSLFLATKSWEVSATDAPMLKVPPHLGVVLSRSAPMRAALEVVARVAPTNATVLLSGETGTGKEVLADLIHSNSARRDQPYVKVNCAAIPETLLESELFGHERGAFTGADRRHVGRFERAHRGTIFLDEIGEVPLPMQVKLLRVLQERAITRVGGTQVFDVDVRIITASNRDLGAAMRRGEFREDLYHRLHVVELRVPPLRERREDIPAFLDEFRREFNRRHGLEVESFAPDALDALYRHAWPGNVRELRNVVERAMLMAAAPTVEREQLAIPDDDPGAEPTRAGPRIEGLTPRQERILRHAREKGGVTNGEIVKRESVSARTALREVSRLVERGLLVRVGRRRGAVYRPSLD